MAIKKSSVHIQTLAACFWVVPAIFLIYLFQYRAEIFLLEVIYISMPLSFYIGFSAPDLPDSKVLKIVSFFPCIVNSLYILWTYPPIFPTFSLFLILWFLLIFPFVMMTYVLFIPLLSLPAVSVAKFFIFIANIVYSTLSKVHHPTRTFFVSVFVIFFLTFATYTLDVIPPISPLPPKTYSETVYISTYGKCYHKYSYCSGMKQPRSIPLEEAREKGYSACLKCYRQR